MPTEINEFEKVLISLRKAFADYNSASQSIKKKTTPDFNAFSIIDCLEIQLSRMIGALLDPNGSHAQGDLFLKLFVDMFLPKRLIPGGISKINLKLEQSDEVAGRLDILVDFDGKFGIGFENKPFAEDLNEQISSYCDYISSRYGEQNHIFVYLSGDGSMPDEASLPRLRREEMGERFVNVPYKQLREWCLKCAAAAKQSGADRLAVVIEEFAEYISREFMGINTKKNELMGKAIENNILEAYEMNLLWQENHKVYDECWREKINELFNIELPKLIFERLKEMNVFNENWDWQNGSFDIRINNFEGFKFFKKNWKHFKIGILSYRCKRENGKCGFFPVIISKEKINRENYHEKYSREMGCKIYKEQYSIIPTQWYSDFPDQKYDSWGYEQWSEIKKGGATVEYIAGFLAKLIKACKSDIDAEEAALKEK